MSSSARKSTSGAVDATETTPSVAEQKKRALEWAERMEKAKQQRVEEEKKEMDEETQKSADELNEDLTTPLVSRRSQRPRKSLAADELAPEPSDAESTVSKRASRRASLPLSAYLPQDEDTKVKVKRSKRRSSMESGGEVRDDVSVSSVDSKASKKSTSKRQSLRAATSLKSLAMEQIPEEEGAEEKEQEKKPKKKKTALSTIEPVPEADEEKEEQQEKTAVVEPVVEITAEAVVSATEGTTESVPPAEEQNLLSTFAEAEKILSENSAVDSAQTIKEDNGADSSALSTIAATIVSPTIVRSSSLFSPARSTTPLQDKAPSTIVMSAAFVSSPLRVSSSPSVVVKTEVLPLPTVVAPSAAPLPEIVPAVSVAPLPLVSAPVSTVEIAPQEMTKEEEQGVSATQDMLENALYATGAVGVLLGLCFDFNTWLVIIFLFVTVALMRRLGKMMLHYQSKDEDEEEHN